MPSVWVLAASPISDFKCQKHLCVSYNVLDIHTHGKSGHQNATAAMVGVFAGGNKRVILLLCWWMIGIKSRFLKKIQFLIESGFCQKLFARHSISYKKSNL